MKNTISIIITLIVAIFITTSCDENSYSKVYTFDQNKLPSKPLEFEYNSVSSQDYYDVIVKLKYTQRIEHNQFVFDYKLTTEPGDSLAITLGVILRSQDGTCKGIQDADTFTLEQVLMKKQRLPKGKNVFSITPAMNLDTIYNISQLELLLVESD
ncbi:MAG TPA: hypothetical protein PK734_04965 [Bacteroidales bacterium]|nr:MAG: hypothetical protein BWY22_00299 [Bacteroidetes bacterium ADurb.Bin217]HOS83379.1 hypothetical protein [Bacteroidales bacterium]HPM12823.1 hypothetical protein [Bacteroidales bacterium]